MKKYVLTVVLVCLVVLTLINLKLVAYCGGHCWPDWCESEAESWCEYQCSPYGGCDGVMLMEGYCGYPSGGPCACCSVWWILCNQGGFSKFYCSEESVRCQET